MSYVVIQIAPNVHPRDKNVPKGTLTGMGVMVPVSCDGFYADAQTAHDVAAWMSDEMPNLQTVLAEVVVRNGWVSQGMDEFPAMPVPEGRAPDPFMGKAKERAKMTPKLRYATIKADGYRCRACGFAVQDGAQLHVDHIVAVANGGRTVEGNLQTLCASCNQGKGAQ